MEKLIIDVEGMSCGHCEHAVEEALLAINGVKKAKASYKKKRVVVKVDTSIVTVNQLKDAIIETGFKA